MFATLALFGALLDDARPTTRELLATVTVAGQCERGCPSGNVTIGAGEIVDRRPDGALVVLTARHVIDAASPTVYVRNGARPGIGFDAYLQPGFGRRASVLAYARNIDLALVSFYPTSDDDYEFAVLAGVEAQPRLGTGVVVGHPNGSLWTVSDYRLLERSADTLLLECSTCGPGDSGGGVFDADGGLLGILIRQRVEGDDERTAVRTSQFQAVSLAELRMFLDATRAEGSSAAAGAASRAWLRFDAMRRS